MMVSTTCKQIPLLALLAGLSILPAVQAEEMSNTLITSLHLEMQGTAEKNYFYFSGDVVVKGTNLEIICDELTVVSLREGPEGATVGSIGAIEEIVARGDVEIHQAGRSAYSGLAEVNPQAGTVVLSESPRIVDEEVEVAGYQFVLHKGEKKFTSVPDPNAPAEQPSRSVVRLGAMPDLGFDQDEESVSVDDSLEQVESPEEEIVEGGGDVTTP
jgi:lipopolysaccharide export system protein LptA